VLTLVLAGCGCTQAGCEDVLLFDRAQIAAWIESDSFSIEVCTDGECTTSNVSAEPTQTKLGFPINAEASDEIDVDVAVTAGSVSKQASGSIEIETRRPNGSFCPPACKIAEVSIEGGALVNAPSPLVDG
jgi:hypothetical protein